MSVGENIKRFRELAHIKQKELAERIGTTSQNISQYERSVRKPKYETLLKIASVLGCEISDLDPTILVPHFDIQWKVKDAFFPSKETFAQTLDDIMAKVEATPDQAIVMQALDLFDSLTPEMQEQSIRFLSLSPQEQEEALEFLSYAPELRQAAMALMRVSREAKA